MSLPTGLQSLTVGAYSTKAWRGLSLPTGLQSRIFLESRVNLSMEKVSLPSGLQSHAISA